MGPRSQQPILVLIGEGEGGSQPVLISNHTRQAWAGQVRVTDGESRQTMWQGVPACGPGELRQVAVLDLPSGKPRLVLCEWQGVNATGGNHYFVGHPPLSLDQCRSWLGLLEHLRTDRQG